MRPTHLATFALVATLTLAAACTSNATPTPTPTRESTAIATAAATPPPSPSATPKTYVPPEKLEVLGTVWLIDLRDDTVVTLAEDEGDYPYSATFNLAGLAVLEYWRGGRSQQIFDIDGALLGEVIPQYACEPRDDDTIRVAGQDYEGITCGLISPNHRYMLYNIDAGTYQASENYEAPLWDQWLVDLETDERTLLHAGMRHCGGCGGRYGPAWSPSGRYAYFPELIGDGEVFLTDALTSETRSLASGSNATDLTRKPVWSPTNDRLLYVGADERTLLEDLQIGTTFTLADVPWPAWFDASGRYLYSPAYEDERLPSSTRQTSVFDATTGQLIATREGAPSSGRVWGAGGDPIAATPDGFVAALEDVVDCRGTTIYTAGTSEGFCVVDGFGATVSPDGSQVALAIRGERVPVRVLPSDSVKSLQLHDIAIVDVSTGAVRIVASEAVSGAWPPQIEWDASGTKILVRWPAWFGV